MSNDEKTNQPIRVSKEQVISKLKDDGDFDNLRLKIIRKLKDNVTVPNCLFSEELRNNIISIVRLSAAINRPGAEEMKPRQLSDAIFDEVGSKVMGQISDNVWDIIRSENGMKKEITDTVQSVYNKLVEPERKELGESSTHVAMVVQNGADDKGTTKASTIAVNGNLSDSELNEPPGFSLSNNHQNNNHEQREEVQLPIPGEGHGQEQKQRPDCSKHVVPQRDIADLGVMCGFSGDNGDNQLCDVSDEDPDVPPGFG